MDSGRRLAVVLGVLGGVVSAGASGCRPGTSADPVTRQTAVAPSAGSGTQSAPRKSASGAETLTIAAEGLPGASVAPPVSRAPVTQLALGDGHSCALHEDGAVSCWGANSAGQVGDGGDVDRVTPGRVVGLPEVAAIAAGEARTCALSRAGDVWCWGMQGEHDPDARAAAASPQRSLVPVRVEGLAGITQLTASCGLRAGRIVCWNGASDVQPIEGLADAASVSGSLDQGCAVRTSGAVACWERGAAATAVQVGKAAAVGVGRDFACAQLTAGGVACWGINNHGQLGRGTVTRTPVTMRPTPPRRFTPMRVTGITDVRELVVRGAQACVLDRAGAVQCWGGTFVDRLTDGPRAVPAKLEGLVARHIAAGDRHACAVTTVGVSCWGLNRGGALGLGWEAHRPVATLVPGITDATTVFAGNGVSCATRANGNVACWGHGDATVREVPGVSGVAQLVAGTVDPIVRDRAGALVLLEHTAGRLDLRSIRLPAPATDVAQATMFGCAIVGTGAVACWGQNRWGEFGDGGRAAESKLVGVMGGDGVTDAVQIATGSYHACVVRRGGTLACWGDALDDTTLGRSASVAPRLLDVRQVAAGTSFVCARLGQGSVTCWGQNERGELGDGTAVAHIDPRPVLGISDAVELAAASEIACVRRGDGKVACWGRGVEGQLGAAAWRDPADPAKGGRSRPIEVQGLTEVIDIGVGGEHACAVRRDGTVACWGATGRGQVGTYATEGSARPQPVRWP